MLLKPQMNMKNLQLTLLVAFMVTFVTKNFAQPKHYDIKNGIGLEGGITQFDIFTDNFETTRGQGWIGSLSTTVDLPHKWYNLSYSVQLSENNFGILGRASNSDITPVAIDFKVLTAQIALLWHVRIAKGHFTIDFGPMAQFNSKLEFIDDDQQGFLINGYDEIVATDITEISNIGLDGTVGATLGFSHFKLQAQYIYGLSNILSKLNSNEKLSALENENKFKGNMSMIALTAIISI